MNIFGWKSTGRAFARPAKTRVSLTRTLGNHSLGEASRLHVFMGHAEDAIAAMARDLPAWRVASNVFLRSLVARDPAGPWAGLVEYRIRVLAQ